MPFSLPLDAEIRVRLEEAAGADRPASQVAQRAIQRYLDAQDALRREIDSAVAEADGEGSSRRRRSARGWTPGCRRGGAAAEPDVLATVNAPRLSTRLPARPAVAAPLRRTGVSRRRSDGASARQAAERIILDNPYVGRPTHRDGVRRLTVARTPFVIVYRIADEQIEVVRIIDGRSFESCST